MMVNRSLEIHGVGYTNYLGDGDSSSFSKVMESRPYGDSCTITKLECVGHVQKRMGSQLRKLKATYKSKVLDNGKSISGHNRLTDSQIDSLQVYYGMAIRNNTGNLDNMKQAIWAIYFHKLSTNDKPFHGLCPNTISTWCKYNKAKLSGETFDHKNSLPSAIMAIIKPIFLNLSQPELLKKCLHGKTQNVNESFNNALWTRCPKRVFVGLMTLEICAYDAVGTFNNGNISRYNVLQELGISDPGRNTLNGLQELDRSRILSSEANFSRIDAMARGDKRRKRKLIEEAEEGGGADYGPGLF